MKSSEDRLRFGDFTLDLRRHTLHRGDARIHLTSKPLETLTFLVSQRGRVVTKEELLAAVWKDVAVTDGVLVQAVREIRRVLADDKDNPTFIQTVPREGYRFIAEVAGADDALRVPAIPARRLPFQMLALAAACVVAFVAWRTFTAANESSAASADPQAHITPLTSAGISAVKPVFSPDGKALLYVSDAPESPGVLDLFLMPSSGGEPWRLTHLANAAGDMPVFMADGSAIVFSRYRTGSDGSRLPDLWKVSSFGGPVVRYLQAASGAGFSPDGAWVAYTRHTSDGRTLMLGPTARLDDAREVSRPGYTPRWSPDGRWLAYTTSNPEGDEGDLWIVSTTLTERRRLTREPQQLYGITWSADSQSIIFAARKGNVYHLWRVAVANGRTEPLTSGVGDYVSPTVLPDGGLVAFTQLRPVRDLVRARPYDATQTNAVTTNESHRSPRLSPSGRFVASVVQRSTVDDYLYVTDLETNASRRVSDVPANYPSWITEDLLAYLTAGGGQIRRANLATGENSALAQLSAAASWLAIRPGGQEAAFVAAAGDHKRIVLRNLASGRESVVVQGVDFESLSWRADGKVLAWSGPRVSADRQTNGVTIVEIDGAAPHQVVVDGYGPVWSRDGSIFFARYLGDRDDAGIWRWDPASGRESQIRRAARIDYFDVAGDSLILARATGRSQVFAMPLTATPLTESARK